MHYQAYSEEMVRDGVAKYGVAGGGRAMMSNEYLHADEAVKSGIYITYYCPSKKSECFRVGSNSKCFCGHLFKEHNKSIGAKKINTTCLSCPCKAFMYIPTRPEEVGMWWLPRRKEFDVRTWRAKCKCTHTHEEHAPTRPFRCKQCAKCSDFIGDFACITCDKAWHDHEMLYETEDERRMEKKPVGKEFYPLSQYEDIQEMVFNPANANKPTPFMRPRPKGQNAPAKKPITQGTTAPQLPYEEEEEKLNKAEFDMGFSSKPLVKPSINPKIGANGPTFGGVKSNMASGTGISNSSINKSVPVKSSTTSGTSAVKGGVTGVKKVLPKKY